MTRTIWMNGTFMPDDQATVSVFDRGLLFADAVYEGLGVLDGRVVDFDYHMARLNRSLDKLDMAAPMDGPGFAAMLTELIARNDLDEGFIYLHITRGVQERDYLFPDGLTPNVFAFTQPQHGARASDPPAPLRLATTPDLRWARRDIKTSNLLGQVLAKRAADAAGADEALMVDPQGYITECGAMSFFAIIGGRLHARPLGRDLLPGVTRRTMLEVAAETGIPVVEDRITPEQAYGADEAFATGASSYIQPVTSIDGRTIGKGSCGPVTARLRAAYLDAVRARM